MKGSCVIIWLYLLFILFSCKTDEPSSKESALFELKSNSEIGIDFENQVNNSEDFNIFNYRNFYNGGGVAIGDLNNDGLADVYLTANMGSNKLYLNKGDWQFEDISASAHVEVKDKWSTGVVLVDINADGWLDIYVCNAGYIKGQDQRNVLFINNGDLTFTESAEAYGLDLNGYTTHVAFFDQDKDGDLDAYILNNSFIPTNTLNYSNKRELRAEDWPVAEFLQGGGDMFLRNEDGKFEDASEEAGIYQSLIGFGLGVTVGDVNEDGYEDLYISNDFFERDYLYVNDRSGGFEEKLPDYFEHISHSSMGADMRDINNDGHTDLFVTDMMPRSEYRLKTTASFDDINLRRLKIDQGFYNQFMHNTLQLNNGNGKFKDISFHADVASSDWSWGALMFDGDMDGWTDLFVCNGVYHDVIDLDFMDFFANDLMQKMVLTGKKEDMQTIVDQMPSVPVRNNMFRNIGGRDFKEVGEDWGFDAETFSNGAAYGDLDNDGDYDLIINNVNQAAMVYENRGDNKGIKITLNGPAKNPFAIGTKIKAVYDGGTQIYEQHPSRGFQSSVDYTVLLGKLNQQYPNYIEVIWPDGEHQIVESVDSMSIVISYAPSQENTASNGKNTQALFTTVDVEGIEAHSENDYVDYYQERGLYRTLSSEGPAAAIGDVNNDGIDDLFIGGAEGQAGEIYLGSTSLQYRKVNNTAFADDQEAEDVCAAFFDADNDGDLDLCVGSGGNHKRPNDPLMRDRLYLNDGRGHFVKADRPLAIEGMNTSVIQPWDFDEDGDMDLFIGSRSVPKNFGFKPLHFLLENNGSGVFTDVGEKVAGNFKDLGMVTSACLSNVNESKAMELVIVGEWMAPTILKYDVDKAALIRLETDLDNRTGWYFDVASSDLNGDGLDDLIFGNTGTNTYLESRSSGLWKLWVNDFDNNGFVDKIITYEQDGLDVPMHQKKDLADQLVTIKKDNLKHVEYAKKSIQDLFEASILDKCKVLECNERASIVALNKGYGTYDVQPMPFEAQLSSIKAICPVDIDSDGDMDLLIGGNDYNLIPQMSRLDASFGGLLINDGSGVFQFIDEHISGIQVEGEVKNILPLNGEAFMFVRNNMKPAVAENIK